MQGQELPERPAGLGGVPGADATLIINLMISMSDDHTNSNSDSTSTNDDNLYIYIFILMQQAGLGGVPGAVPDLGVS